MIEPVAHGRLPLDPDSMPKNCPAQGPAKTHDKGMAHHRGSACLPQPYPPAVARGPDAKAARLVRIAYCGADCSELSAVMQYFYHSLILRECAPQAAQEILSIAICEMHHLDLLGSLLCSMGNEPKFYAPRRSMRGMQNSWWTAQPPAVAYSDGIGAALQADIEAEQQAIADYRRMTQEIKDAGIVRLIERILLDEEEHLRIFTALLQRLCG